MYRFGGGGRIKPSPMQMAIALSSAGFELYTATRALRETKGFNPLGTGFGEDLSILAFVDDHARIGISCRAGLGKARHIDTVELWIKGTPQSREFELAKLRGGVA